MQLEFVVSQKDPHLGGNIRGGDPFTFCPGLWEWFIQSFDVGSVLDVGSAEGHALRFFHSRGIRAVGIEGLEENARQSIVPTLLWDLTHGPVRFSSVDLVWCCEVVEHILPGYLENLLQTITVGKYLAMTAAEPGQPGHHHVNCKPLEYWVNELKRYRMRFDPEITKEGKTKDKHNNHFGWHGMIFVKEG